MRTARQLPIYAHKEHICFIDFKLKELRPIDEPYNSIPFTALTEQEKAEVRAIRAEFWGVYYMPELDD